MQKTKRPVYNEEQKLKFIQETIDNENVKSVAMSLFRAIAPIEFEKSADVCTFNAKELNQVVDAACGLRTRSKYVRKGVLQKYLQWCIAEGIPNAKNEIDYITTNGEERVKTMLVKNPEHLQVCLNKVFDPEREETQDNVLRFFFWMAYGGMPEEKIVHLTKDNINLAYMEAVDGDDVAIIYRQGLPAIYNCINLSRFLYKNQNYVNSGDIYRDRVPGNELIRGIRGTQSLDNFRSQLSKKLRIKRSNGIESDELTYSRVWLSGVFYRLYEKEQAGIEPNFYAVAMESPGGVKALQKGSADNKRKTLSAIAFGFRSDYERWKNVIV